MLICPICFDGNDAAGFVPVCISPCGHVMCESCVARVQHPECPLCKHPFSPAHDVRRIFLTFESYSSSEPRTDPPAIMQDHVQWNGVENLYHEVGARFLEFCADQQTYITNLEMQNHNLQSMINRLNSLILDAETKHREVGRLVMYASNLEIQNRQLECAVRQLRTMVGAVRTICSLTNPPPSSSSFHPHHPLGTQTHHPSFLPPPHPQQDGATTATSG